MDKDTRKLRDLPPPQPKKAGLTLRYQLTATNQSLVIEDKATNSIYSDESPVSEPQLLELLHRLVAVANERYDTFDALLNALGAFQAIYNFLRQRFPSLSESGVLQPLVDLNASLHDRVVGEKGGILADRIEEFDGSYDRFEEFESVTDPRKPTRRPIRTYDDMLEAMLVVAFEVIKQSSSHDEACTEMTKLLSKSKVKDGANGNPMKRYPETGDVVKWCASGENAAKGRFYCIEGFRMSTKERVAQCKSKEDAVKFAKEFVEKVRRGRPIFCG